MVLRRKLVCFAVALAALTAAGCGREAPDGTGSSAQTGDDEAVVFPVQDPTSDARDALLAGTLVERERCLYVSSDGAPGHVLPIWPHGFSYDHGAGRVLDSAGEAVASVDAPVSLGGGMAGEGEAELPAELEERVGSCDGPYWLVGEVLEGES